MIAALGLFVSLAALACANPVARDLVVHERRASAPPGFVLKTAAPAGQTLNLRVAIKQGSISGLEERLLDISSPKSTDFRAWLSKDEVRSLMLFVHSCT